MGKLLDALAGLIKLGVNLSAPQKAYLEWRASDDGKAHFNQEEENAFYEALEKGDTSVIDVQVKETQDKIDKLRKRVGLAVVLVTCLCAGCKYTIPEKLHAVPESLTTTERSYVMSDVEISTPDGHTTLSGQWHVISGDAMKVNRRNQQDLVLALEELQSYQHRAKIGLAVTAVATLVGLVIGFALGRSKR